MKYFKWMTFVVILAFTLSACALPETEMAEKGIYPVTRVVDGDTFKVDFDGEEETIRLLLIDTPETVHPNKPVQPFGKEASHFMKERLEGQKVELELDVSERDKYGRILAYAYDMDGNMLNEMLLHKGLARVAYIFPPNTKYVDRFQAIQKEAQKQGVGIWSLENYVTEDGFSNTESETDGPSTNEKAACDIKGNINSSGDKIYHMPDGAYYAVTKAEEMFCSEEEAEKAGFRPSSR